MDKLRFRLSDSSCIITAVLLIVLCYGCSYLRRNREAENIIRLLKNGEYAQVKEVCHYNPPWDPTDSIFDLNVRFIHTYLNKFGDPRRLDFKSLKDLEGNPITRVYLNKIALMDSTLDSAYIEIDYFNPATAFSMMHHSIKTRLFTDFLKLAPHLITNFYFIKMRKGENYNIK